MIIQSEVPDSKAFSFQQSQFQKSLYLDARGKCSGLVHWEDPEGSGGEGGGRGDRDGEHM